MRTRRSVVDAEKQYQSILKRWQLFNFTTSNVNQRNTAIRREVKVAKYLVRTGAAQFVLMSERGTVGVILTTRVDNYI